MTTPEATDSPLIVTYDGKQYKIPPSDSWPIEALEMLAENNVTGACRLIVGDKQYAEFRKQHTTVGQLKAFMAKVGEAGNSGN